MSQVKENAGDVDNLRVSCESLWKQVKDIQAELQNVCPLVFASGGHSLQEGESQESNLNSQSSTSNRSASDEFQSSSLHHFQILKEHEKRLKAELLVIKKLEPKSLPENASLQKLFIEQDQNKKTDRLKESLFFVKAMRTEMLECIKKEEETHSSLESLNQALKKKFASMEQMQATSDPIQTVESAISRLTDKYNTLKSLDKHFKVLLKDILVKYFPLPQETDGKGSAKKTPTPNRKNLKSLYSIVGKLIEQTLNSPEQPYIDIDDTFWSAHLELLLRCQVVLKDPNCVSRIKLVPFHL